MGETACETETHRGFHPHPLQQPNECCSQVDTAPRGRHPWGVFCTTWLLCVLLLVISLLLSLGLIETEKHFSACLRMGSFIHRSRVYVHSLIYTSISPAYTYQPAHPWTHPPAHPPIYSPTHPSIHLCCHPSIHPPIHPSTHPPRHAPNPCVHPCIRPPIYLASQPARQPTRQPPTLLPLSASCSLCLGCTGGLPATPLAVVHIK